MAEDGARSRRPHGARLEVGLGAADGRRRGVELAPEHLDLPPPDGKILAAQLPVPEFVLRHLVFVRHQVALRRDPFLDKLPRDLKPLARKLKRKRRDLDLVRVAAELVDVFGLAEGQLRANAVGLDFGALDGGLLDFVGKVEKDVAFLDLVAREGRYGDDDARERGAHLGVGLGRRVAGGRHAARHLDVECGRREDGQDN